jgi:hypothetical protein
MDIDKILIELIDWLKVKRNIWIKDFAHIHNISFAKLKFEALKNEETKELMQIALEIQESKLIKIILTSDLNAKTIYYILDFINKSPVSFENDSYKSAPVINFYELGSRENQEIQYQNAIERYKNELEQQKVKSEIEKFDTS